MIVLRFPFWSAVLLAVVPCVDGAGKPFPGEPTDWNGLARHDFLIGDKEVTVVVPETALAGNPWAWRGEFFGAFANADVELVKDGFHLVYVKVPNLFGSPGAVAAWNEVYAELTGKYGLSAKPALIGLSRGGLYCFNWAAANPYKVSCIYADAAVCDFKSWPGGAPHGLGRGKGSEAEWQRLMTVFGFKSEAEATSYPGNPVDNLQPLAEAKVPILLVYGDADDVVPHDENALVMAERYTQLNAPVELICKPGIGHHPHGLTDPKPIVDFIERNAK